MAYLPSPLVVAVRDRSISAGLAASTVTPAMIAPELSRTCPEIVLCAHAMDANRTKMANPTTTCRTDPVRGICFPPFLLGVALGHSSRQAAYIRQFVVSSHFRRSRRF